MKRTPAATTPDAYVESLDGWRRVLVEQLRDTVRAATRLDEVIKWGHLVYLAGGPVLLIRAEERRVLLGFWRGQLLRDIEPALKPGGKYEMATLHVHEGMMVDLSVVDRLTKAAVELNRRAGDPTGAAEVRSNR